MVDGTGGPPRPDTDVLIDGDRIAAVGIGAADDAPPGTTTLDASGHTVMPGLIDAHCHVTFGEPASNDELFWHRPTGTSMLLAAFNVPKLLRAGVTGFLDADCIADLGPALRDGIEAGLVEGPRMSSGLNALLTAAGGTAGRLIPDHGTVGYAQVVRDRDEIVRTTRQQVKYGADWIKVHLTDLDAERAAEFARRHNDELAGLVARAPDRLGGLAQLPTQDPEFAAAELVRAVEDLGLLGAAISTDPGPALDDRITDVLWSTAVELDVPVLLHPAPSGVAGTSRDERLGRFDAELWLGFAYEEALAVATIVLGGVLDRHPDLDLCVSHGGGATSWIAERLEHAAMTRPWAEDHLREEGAISDRLRRLWWDAHVGGPRALAALVATVGVDRLVGGTNLAGWDEDTDPTHGDASLAATLDANARRLLRLDGRHRRSA